ncbi:LPXTG cell wall anchor domain-containing protein [Arthrobacter nitrophenolicus]|uniref:LPXTG cell wall anchor domain-containing protein n=1 Tax=Arthrobacter nitrophenolicus TaxID=683150 RepID=A0A4R5Y1K0_9MICC|nr:LPXTG cell wall anchor domain-containing protein [Arthrobacter nitrophenolicus]TDL37396.1 LPXTG cell wall anchor domain-containing protein [Arthrobacter nitrophenolicus]
MKKTLAALALAGSIALVGAAPSMAATYPALPPQAAVSDGVVGPGEDFIFSGQGFLAGETLTISVTPGDAPASDGASIAGGAAVASAISLVLDPFTLTTTADAQGKFSLPISLGEAGTYSISATGNTSGVTVGPVSVTVATSLANTGGNAGGAPLASTGGKGTGLANTGADSGLVLWTLVGAGALAAGATSVIVVRRRAKAEAAA